MRYKERLFKKAWQLSTKEGFFSTIEEQG